MPSIGQQSVAGRRVLITGAARGIGAALARRLHSAGAQVALLGLEPELLAEVARDCGDAPWEYCDVADRAQVERAVVALADRLGGLDVVVANAGIARQLALIDGDPAVLEQTLQVNVLGTYYTLRAAGPYIAHPGGYVLLTASLAASLHLPLIGAYSASKAAVAALGNTVRQELRYTGAKVGVAFYSELDTEMTSRGFDTAAARSVQAKGVVPVGALSTAIRRIERGIARRSRTIVAPWWVSLVMFGSPVSQRVVELALRRSVAQAVAIAATEDVPFTTPQPERTGGPAA
ncbi:SDR family NAD(P)-dependent oxidoreductase [Skermania piniformis]|uniref:SDR family NAD(P)-dependent oxidoreductase n=1 Tax=Skermania pinensis TaxID=39122 RepID=A0ABX8S8A1_9ACTN|nr:SDR family NAD(P)-dependent oxidoreductase [Skermania piniformis]QXQ13993.1 SDR family NAD(P)-dependent oxidoreductase [Skermania piniformis]